MTSPEENKPLILVVDDQRINIKLLEEQLSKAGYLVISADDGDEAIRVTKSTVPDLILMDVMMPLRDGFEACKLIKEDPALAEVPVIFLTGRSQTKDVIAGFKAGGVDYIAKPFNSAELLVRVQTHLDLRRARSRLREMTSDIQNANNNQKKMLSILAYTMDGHLGNATKAHRQVHGRVEEAAENKKVNFKDTLETSDVVEQELASVRNLLDNLLDWSKLQMNEMPCRPRPTGLKATISKNLEAIEASLEFKKLKIALNVPESHQAMADPDMLSTIFRILLSGALKFAAKGGKLAVTGEVDGRDLHVTVQDQGVGGGGLFSMFRSKDAGATEATADDDLAGGLGLELCAELIRRNGGEVLPDSRLGRGSTYAFRLPKA